jgi:hypothetical protein
MDISTRGGMSGPTQERIVAATRTPVFRMKKPGIERPGDAGEEPDIIAKARLLS